MARVRQGTYSIVARDPATGALGVAVQSHWFSVGPIVPWAEPGIGAVATQANVEISYGPRMLELLAGGVAIDQALETLIAADPYSDTRQVAAVDAAGRVVAHTGSKCIPFAGDIQGDGVSCQANIMASESVWPAMLETFASAEGVLAERLLLALEAAEREGGDLRGRQSAALLVVPASGAAWEATVCLRVEDHDAPLVELRRLLRLHDAYELAGQADELVGEGRHDEAATLYERASALAPDNHELLFWAGLGAAQSGDVKTGARRVQTAISMQPGWRELLGRMPADVAPGAAEVLSFISQRQ